MNAYDEQRLSEYMEREAEGTATLFQKVEARRLYAKKEREEAQEFPEYERGPEL